ncbi:hypothetical protein K040078D81_28450 [Blautia hominis]|uniref:Transposase n=1 Tax=Blautia hominis TaxID=2025493 RepID=A0ABQ0BBI9_9FIRM
MHQLLEEYHIQTAEDIQDALKDFLGGTIKEMMEAVGSMEINVPQDIRYSTYTGFVSAILQSSNP